MQKISSKLQEKSFKKHSRYLIKQLNDHDTAALIETSWKGIAVEKHIHTRINEIKRMMTATKNTQVLHPYTQSN